MGSMDGLAGNWRTEMLADSQRVVWSGSEIRPSSVPELFRPCCPSAAPHPTPFTFLCRAKNQLSNALFRCGNSAVGAEIWPKKLSETVWPDRGGSVCGDDPAACIIELRHVLVASFGLASFMAEADNWIAIQAELHRSHRIARVSSPAALPNQNCQNSTCV
eukprot:1145960-Pelagomonas_calceolata.AAC.6